MARKLDLIFIFPIRVVIASALVCWVFVFAVGFAIFGGTEAIQNLRDFIACAYEWAWNPALVPDFFGDPSDGVL